MLKLALNSELLLINQQPQNWLIEINKFSLLKQQVKKINPKIKH
jgi:hypothetical protein